jgi:hypothetical protein
MQTGPHARCCSCTHLPAIHLDFKVTAAKRGTKDVDEFIEIAFWFRRKRLCNVIKSGAADRSTAWMWSTLVALAISHLWVVAANGHMTHTFFNAIVFYIPFLATKLHRFLFLTAVLVTPQLHVALSPLNRELVGLVRLTGQLFG